MFAKKGLASVFIYSIRSLPRVIINGRISAYGGTAGIILYLNDHIFRSKYLYKVAVIGTIHLKLLTLLV